MPATIFVPDIAGRANAGAVRVIGVEPDGAPTLTRARASGGPAGAPAGSIGQVACDLTSIDQPR